MNTLNSTSNTHKKRAWEIDPHFPPAPSFSNLELPGELGRYLVNYARWISGEFRGTWKNGDHQPEVQPENQPTEYTNIYTHIYIYTVYIYICLVHICIYRYLYLYLYTYICTWGHAWTLEKSREKNNQQYFCEWPANCWPSWNPVFEKKTTQYPSVKSINPTWRIIPSHLER